MKITLSIILALVMALSLSVTAFAETNDGSKQDLSKVFKPNLKPI